MEENKTNSAKRICNLIEEAKSIIDGSYYQIWGSVFKLSQSDRLEHDVAFCLNLLVQEIDLMNLEIERQKVYIPPKKSHLVTNGLYNIVNLGIYNQAWKSHRDILITDEMITLLSMVAGNMKADETIISDEEIEELIGYVSDLKKHIEDSLVSDSTKIIILNLIKNIDNAIKSYQVKGAVVYKDVISLITGDLFLYKDEIIDEGKGILKSLSDIFNLLVHFNNRYTEFKSLGDNVIKLLSN